MNDKLAKTDEPQNLMSFIGSAIERLGGEGAKDAAEAIKTLVQLKREEDAIDAKRSYAEAMRDFAKGKPVIVKNRENRQVSQSGSVRTIPYADLSEIERKIRPLATDLGFSWTYDSEPSNDGHWLTVFCDVMHTGGHEKRHRALVPIEPGSKIMNATQAAGTAIQYGKRYALCQAFSLTTDDEDTDGVAPGSLEPIEEDQQATIEHWLEKSGRPREKFLAWLQAPSVAAIQQRDYARAVDTLKKAASK